MARQVSGPLSPDLELLGVLWGLRVSLGPVLGSAWVVGCHVSELAGMMANGEPVDLGNPNWQNLRLFGPKTAKLVH